MIMWSIFIFAMPEAKLRLKCVYQVVKCFANEENYNFFKEFSFFIYLDALTLDDN